ncbi:DUF456 domain-containing protein [Janthinobacterium sp. B9-8]|uniref:DUF456 domain-containing protein n=1 Tax=Janthinobacterium sp. B9-8 TaxID=1236179 RepID=UPI00061D1034|nr:DUF456 family protein [Janthinobacterium sp. B9-8]AMC33174.1 hypothetical protein VN23_00310 [Janthinobacterium sp. B9-8]
MPEFLTADIGWWVLAWVLMISGLLGTLLPFLPSTPFIFGGMLLAAYLDQFVRVGYGWLTVLGLLLILSMALDYIAGALGAKKAGASPAAVWGALIGGILGIFAGLAGLLLGPFIGAAVGEFWAKKDVMQAGKVGIATFIGMLVGAVAKIAIGLSMFAVFAFAWWV